MIQSVKIGDSILEGEKIEQITEEIISILAQHKLNYEAAIYVLNTTKEQLGWKCTITGSCE